jgi:hypothetical protein
LRTVDLGWLPLAALILLAGCPRFPEDGRYACFGDDAECPDGLVCLGGECVAPAVDRCVDPTCSIGEVCHPDTGTCVECLTPDDCLARDEVCDTGSHTCVVPCTPSCEDGAICDVTSTTCVECLEDGDCGVEGMGGVCEGNVCACTGDTGCPGELLCDVDEGSCHACLDETDCDADEICQSGFCVSECDPACIAGSGTPFCHPNTGDCRACILDGDCDDAGLECSPEGECVSRCDPDPCDGEGHCVPETGDCVACIVDDHCDVGGQCIGNWCEMSCSLQCDGNQVCRFDARIERERCFDVCEDTETCRAHETCREDADGTRYCRDEICVPQRLEAMSPEIIDLGGQPYGSPCEARDYEGICLGPQEISPGFIAGVCRLVGAVQSGTGNSCRVDALHRDAAEICAGVCAFVDGVGQCYEPCRPGNCPDGYCFPLYGVTGACVPSQGDGRDGEVCGGWHECADRYLCVETTQLCMASCEVHEPACPPCVNLDDPNNPLLGYCDE